MYQQRLRDLGSRIQSVENRIKELEKRSLIDNNVNDNEESGVARVKNDLLSRKVFSFRFIRVAADYYDRPLQDRANMLSCQTSQLCKSIVFENTACDHERIDDYTNSRYYCIIVQYEARFDAELLRDLIHSLRTPSTSTLSSSSSSSSSFSEHQLQHRLPKKRFNFRLAPEVVSGKLSGFLHNAVSPFGMISPIPVIICQRVLEVTPRYIYLGGGEVDLKLGIATDDMIHALNPGVIIGLISHPRQQQQANSSSSASNMSKHDDDDD